MILTQKCVLDTVLRGLSRPDKEAVERSVSILTIFARRLIEVPEPVAKELPILKALFKTAKVMENVKEVADVDKSGGSLAHEFLKEFVTLG
ncbi:hypothetical protein GEMRC1_002504 [Eukaryota sp. GEM-RC1]